MSNLISLQGILANGEEIAVKKLAPGSTHGSKGFSNEVRLLLKLQHRNLIQLFGCCVEGEHRMLVYEYLHNKSLDYFLFGNVAGCATCNALTRCSFYLLSIKIYLFS